MANINDLSNSKEILKLLKNRFEKKRDSLNEKIYLNESEIASNEKKAIMHVIIAAGHVVAIYGLEELTNGTFMYKGFPVIIVPVITFAASLCALSIKLNKASKKIVENIQLYDELFALEHCEPDGDISYDLLEDELSAFLLPDAKYVIEEVQREEQKKLNKTYNETSTN